LKRKTMTKHNTKSQLLELFLFYFIFLIYGEEICLSYFFYLRGCPGQLARTTTNPTAHWIPCKPNEHVRHREDDKRAHKNSNREAMERDKLFPPPGQDPQCMFIPINMSPPCHFLMSHVFQPWAPGCFLNS